MLLFSQFKKLIAKYFIEMRWHTIVLALIFYAASSWLLLALAGEPALLEFEDFIYWLVVTGSTVGYGDFSPTTHAGKILVALYVIPVGLSIFALVVGRAAAFVSEQWQRGLKGLKAMQLENHIVLIGWNDTRTIQLLNLLLQERNEMPDKPDILLCVRVDITNPMPEHIHFVKVESFNKDEDMDRACIADASVILIDNPEDDMTMTTALYCSHRNPSAHKVAYFKDESLVNLLQQHCPNVECTPSVAVEMLAKSAFDPGSSKLHYDLLSVEDGCAQYSAQVPKNVDSIRCGELFSGLKHHHDATFIGYVSARDVHQVVLNPSTEDVLIAGDKLFYIARQRINGFDWSALSGGAHVQ